MTDTIETRRDQLRKLAATTPDDLRRHIGKDGIIIGLMGYHVPGLLLESMGICPVWLEPDARSADEADAAIQTFACSQVRGLLARSLRDEFAVCDGFVLGHSCDSIKSLASILRFRFPTLFIDYFRFPTAIAAVGSHHFVRSECSRLCDRVTERFGVAFDERLSAQVLEKWSRTGFLLQAIRREVLDGSSLFSYADLVSMYRMAMKVRTEKVLEELEQLHAMGRTRGEPREERAIASQRGVRVAVIGSRITEMHARLFEQAGLQVCHDDLAWGTRMLLPALNEATTDDPFSAIVESIMKTGREPHNYDAGRPLFRRLMSAVEERNIAGVVYCCYKFCDPWAFDYPALREILERKHIALHFLEIDTDPASAGYEQAKNRLMAFAEQAGG